MLEPLPRTFYERPTARVARELLGKVIVRQDEAGSRHLARIVEVEAYLGLRDLASHARRGPTPRSAIMFGPPGHLYTYLIYGMHVCANFVTEPDGVAGAVLIRAGETLSDGQDKAALRGPGKLCRGLGIALSDKGLDLTRASSRFFVADLQDARPRVARSPRIGVDYAGPWAERPLRFFIPGNPSVSGPRLVKLSAPVLPSRSTRTSSAGRRRPGHR